MRETEIERERQLKFEIDRERAGKGELPHCIIVRTSENPFSLMLISMRFSRKIMNSQQAREKQGEEERGKRASTKCSRFIVFHILALAYAWTRFKL